MKSPEKKRRKLFDTVVPQRNIITIYIVLTPLLKPLFFFTKNFEWTNNYTHALINIEALGIAIVQSFIAYGIAKIIDEIPYIRTLLLGKR